MDIAARLTEPKIGDIMYLKSYHRSTYEGKVINLNKGGFTVHWHNNDGRARHDQWYSDNSQIVSGWFVLEKKRKPTIII